MGDYTNYLNEKCKQYKDIAVLDELTESPNISVIIPCYNSARVLEKCLDSLIMQTFKNFEVICIDDGSKDTTADIISGFTYIDKRFKLIKQSNGGPSKARNTGLNIARGEYITFIDADDWVDTNYLEKLYDSAIKNDCDIAVATIIRKRSHSQKYRVHYTEEKVYTTLQEKINVCKIPTCCYVWNKLYKKSLINNSLFKEGVYFEDVLWIPEILKHSNRMVTVPDTNYYYMVTNNSIVKTNSPKKQSDSYNAKKYIIKFFDENNLDLSKKNKIITKRINYILNIPILRIKEYMDYETYYLFNLIPIYKKRIGGSNG